MDKKIKYFFRVKKKGINSFSIRYLSIIMQLNGDIAGTTAGEPYKVLVIGGSYAGLGATLNLLDLCHGKPCRFTGKTDSWEPCEQIPVQITIVDERDGFCKDPMSTHLGL